MIECVVDARNELGEGPLWDPAAERLFWIDITAHQLHAYRPGDGDRTSWDLDVAPGALAPRSDGGLLVARADGVAAFDPGSGTFTHLADPEPELATNRLNDGTTDRQGRFWFGSMEAGARGRAGSVYRFDLDGTIHRLIEGVGIPNSLAFSPDGTVMYFADSSDSTIWAFDYDPATGTPTGRRVLATTDIGVPDGSTVDVDGCLWNAEWGAARLVRYTPSGAVDRIIEMPVDRPTCCAFGGPDLDVLYVTSARIGSDTPRPLAGGLFAVDTGTSGLLPTPWTDTSEAGTA